MASDKADLGRSQNSGQIMTIIILLACLGVFSTTWEKKKKIAEIDVRGVKYLTRQEIVKFSGLDDSAGLKINSVSLGDIEKNVVKHKFVSSAQAWRKGLSSIVIEVTEREPIAAICRQDGSLKYLDDEGVVLPYRLFSKISDAPIIFGTENQDSNDVRKQCLDVVREMRNYADGVFYRQLGSLTWIADKKCWQARFEDYEITVLILAHSDIKMQLDNLRAILKEIGFTNKLAIDLRWLDKVVVSTI